MARNITLTFSYDLNDLVQVNDIVFSKSGTGFKRLGTITSINFTNKTIVTSVADNVATPSDSTFFFFAKDNKANQADILGYYAEAVMKNNSTAEAELFQLSSEVAESSK